MKIKIIILIVLGVAALLFWKYFPQDSTEIVWQITYHANGNKKTEIVKNGSVKEPERILFRHFYEDGKLNCVYNAKLNPDSSYVKDGLCFCLFDNGDTLSTGPFKNGFLLGTKRSYFKNHKIAIEEKCRRDSICEIIEYREDGTLWIYKSVFYEETFFGAKYNDAGEKIISEHGRPFKVVIDEYVNIQGLKPVTGQIISSNPPLIQRKIIEIFSVERMETCEEIQFESELFTHDSLITRFLINVPEPGEFEVKVLTQAQFKGEHIPREIILTFPIQVRL